MKFICLGYHDESSWDRKSEDERLRFMNECFEYDEELRRGGHVLGGEALDSVQNAVTLRTKGGSVDVTDGPYTETRETLGGILLFEARDLNHAIALMSKHHGVNAGPFEIRAADEEINRMFEVRQAANADKSRERESPRLRRAIVTGRRIDGNCWRAGTGAESECGEK